MYYFTRNPNVIKNFTFILQGIQKLFFFFIIIIFFFGGGGGGGGGGGRWGGARASDFLL